MKYTIFKDPFYICCHVFRKQEGVSGYEYWDSGAWIQRERNNNTLLIEPMDYTSFTYHFDTLEEVIEALKSFRIPMHPLKVDRQNKLIAELSRALCDDHIEAMLG